MSQRPRFSGDQTSRGLFFTLLLILFLNCQPSRAPQGADTASKKGKEVPRHWALLKSHKEPWNLQELILPPTATNLEPITGRIGFLGLANTQIETLKGLRVTVDELDLRFSKIRSLEFTPKNLTALDIRFAADLQDLSYLPPNLKDLKLSGRVVRDLQSLPRSLTSLHLEDTGISSLEGLPTDLEDLVLVGEDFRNLEGLPPKLKSLTLEGTGVRLMKNLPESLQTLILLGNSHLEIGKGDLPQYLTKLILDEARGNPDLSSLQYLTWLSDRRGRPISNLPESIRCITVRALGLPESDLKFPKSLRAVGIHDASLNSLEIVPSVVEVLDLSRYHGPNLNLEEFTSLRKLKLRLAEISKMPRLPESLEKLDISRTAIASLEGLPKGLKALSVCMGQGPVVDWSLLPKLEELDLCGEPDLDRIGVLPKSLKKLNLRDAKIDTLRLSPDNQIQELNISGTDIRLSSLGNLPHLEVLTLDEGQLQRLGRLPIKLRVLRFASPVASEP